jgi:hypothetical protein
MVDPEASQEFNRDVVARLENGRMVGQSIFVRRAGTNGVSVWLRPEKNASGSITLRLYGGQEESGDFSANGLLAFNSIAQGDVVNGGATYFDLTWVEQQQAATHPEGSYFFTLEANGSAVDVLGRNEDAYSGGTLFQTTDGELTPTSADLAFRVSYEYGLKALLGDIARATPFLWLALPFVVLLILPGWLLIDVLRLHHALDLGEQVAFSVGVSLAIFPLVLLWSTVMGAHWNAAMLWGSSITLVFLWLYRVMRAWQQVRWKPISFSPATLQTTALLAVFGLSLIVRFAMVRDLAGPAWVDSVHHATIARLILDQGQFPANYLPYLDVEAQEYHAGYHAGLAAFIGLTKLDLAQGMLIYGQVLNALMVFALYALAKFFTGDRRASVIAGMVAGLLTPMPAYYTSWGRYTQLAGLLILPVVVVFFRDLVAGEKGRYSTAGGLKRGVIVAVAAAGLFLVHYRVAAFTGLLLLAFWVCDFRWERAWNVAHFQRTLRWGAGTGAVALGLSFPWAWPTLVRVFAPIIAAGGQTSELFGDFSWSYLTAAAGSSALALAWVGLAWGIVRLRRWAAALALWVGLLLLMANLGPLGVPGAATFSNNTSVTIAFFIPIGVFSGYAIGQAYQTGRGWLAFRWRRLIQLALSILLIGLGLIGVQKLLPILHTSTLLSRQADRPALEWIKTNIPPDEVVLINPFAWGYNLYAGNDGGFWISPLAERKTIPPPVLYGLETPEQIAHINQICQQVLQNGGDATALWEMLAAQGIRYVYVGGRGGPISSAALHASPLFETLYQQNGAWVFHAKAQK